MANAEDRAIAARVLRDAGHDPPTIADLLHVSRSQVYRYLEATKPDEPEATPAVAALAKLLDGRDLDAAQEFSAVIARQLAVKLDQAVASVKAQDTLAVAQVQKGLSELVTDIVGVSQDDEAWIADVFGTVGDAEDEDAEDAGSATDEDC